jgi:6-pyruvoyl-tetrahydropterin synthase
LLAVCLPERKKFYAIIEFMKLASHFVASHAVKLASGLEEMHAHDWQVVADFSDGGIAVAQLTELLATEAAALENSVLNDLEPLKKYHASAESVAKYLFDKIAARLGHRDVRIIRLEVEEEPGCRAAYRLE